MLHNMDDQQCPYYVFAELIPNMKGVEFKKDDTNGHYTKNIIELCNIN